VWRRRWPCTDNGTPADAVWKSVEAMPLADPIDGRVRRPDAVVAIQVPDDTNRPHVVCPAQVQDLLHHLIGRFARVVVGAATVELCKAAEHKEKLETQTSAGGGIRTRRGPFLRSRRTLTTLVVYERYPGVSRMATSTLRHMFSLHCRSTRPPDVPTFAHVPNGIGGRS